MAAVVLGSALRCARARGGEEPEERRGAGRAREGRGGGVASPGRARAKWQVGGGRARAGGRRPRALQSFWRELEGDKGGRDGLGQQCWAVQVGFGERQVSYR